MNEHKLKRLFPHASHDFLKENIETDDTRQASIPQRPVRQESLVPNKGKKADTARYFICVTSVRKRLLDTDNLVAKYHVDALRYASIIHSDAPNQAEIKVTQRKCKEGEEEHVDIEVFEL